MTARADHAGGSVDGRRAGLRGRLAAWSRRLGLTTGARQAEELMTLFRKDPTAMSVRPAVQAMTRRVTAYLIGHPAGATPEEEAALRRAIAASPMYAELDRIRVRGMTEALRKRGDADATRLVLAVAAETITSGDADELLELLPSGSCILLDRSEAQKDLTTARAAAKILAARGLAFALAGMRAEPHEEAEVSALNPAILVLDVVPALEYHGHGQALVRLRTTRPDATVDVLCNTVHNAVDEWAAIHAGCTMLSGEHYEGLASLAPFMDLRRGDLHLGDGTPYFAAALEHPGRRLDREATRAAWADALTCATSGATIYVVLPADREDRDHLAQACAHAAGSGATVQAVCTALPADDEPLPWHRLAPDDPLVRESALVVLGEASSSGVFTHDFGDTASGSARTVAVVASRDRAQLLRAAALIQEAVDRAS